MATTLRSRYGRPDGPQCNICLKRFCDNRDLRRHKERIHNPNRRNEHECETCHKMFSKRSDMLRHVRTVHLKERRFFCGDCGQAFSQPGNRDQHVRMMHDNIRSAPCFHCGKTFAKDSHLMRHVRTVHDGRILNPRPCPDCDHIAHYPSHLRARRIAAHTQLRFRCGFGCEFWYTRVNNLGTYHLKEVHEVERRYKHYAIPKLLNRAPLPPNASLPVECLSCDMRFRDNADLKFHLVRVHL